MSAATVPVQQATIRQYAKQLQLTTIGGQFVQLAEQAVKEKQGHLSYLEALLGAEVEDRYRNAVARRIKDAHFPKVKTLEEFKFSDAPHRPAMQIRNLAEGDYLQRSEPIILLGEAGTGKTHLATGLAVDACRQRKRVRFTTAAEMVNPRRGPKWPFFEEIGPFSLALHGVFPWGLPSSGVPISRSGCDFCQRLHRACL